MKKWFLFGLVAIFFIVQASAYAQNQQEHHGWMKILSQLNLSADQQKKVDAIMSDVHKNLQAIRLGEKKKRAELSKILLSPNPDRSVAKQKLREILALHNKRQEMFADVYFDILGLLNPSQKQLFAKLVANRMGGDHDHNEH